MIFNCQIGDDDMKLTNLFVATAVAGLGFASLSANAVYNLYKNDGLSLDIHGEVNTRAHNKRQQFEFQYNGTGITYSSTDWAKILHGHYEERADRRTRIGQNDGASWTEFRASQRLLQDWRVTGVVGFGYWDSKVGAYLSNANLSVDKLNVGSLSVGRQYLHNAYVARTGTYTPLETFAASSVRADYTAVDGLHVSAYYNTPSSNDVRNTSNTLEVEGWGTSASYLYPFADKQSVRFAVGYSDSRKNPNKRGRAGNNFAVETQGLATSIEYRHHNLLLATDYGKKKEDFEGNVTDSAKANYAGVKIGYQVTPTFNVMVGHGIKTTKRTNQAGVRVFGEWLSSVENNGEYLANYDNIAQAYETALFDRVEEKRTYAQADYYLRDNVRVYGRIDVEDRQTKLDGKDFAKFKDTDYRLGLSFVF